ncbi:hypothetical protein EBZ80_24230 [bacterium]|nr:hypothetical protein [Betaproteobacteria bacterium]NDE18031.1 hypothetical protein [bacterium]
MAKAKTATTPASPIKDLCPLLEAIGVTRIEAEYDGSGDSGDFNSFTFVFDDPTVQNDVSVLNNMQSNRNTHMYLDQFRRTHCTSADATKPPIMTDAQLAALRDACFDLLPGGWEINEGSFGTIVVDVRRRKVRMEHNERIVEVATTNTEW